MSVVSNLVVNIIRRYIVYASKKKVMKKQYVFDQCDITNEYNMSIFAFAFITNPRLLFYKT